jgi:hypothetical protein
MVTAFVFCPAIRTEPQCTRTSSRWVKGDPPGWWNSSRSDHCQLVWESSFAICLGSTADLTSPNFVSLTLFALLPRPRTLPNTRLYFGYWRSESHCRSARGVWLWIRFEIYLWQNMELILYICEKRWQNLANLRRIVGACHKEKWCTTCINLSGSTPAPVKVA